MSYLSVLNPPLGATDDTLRGEQTLQQLQLVQRHIGAEGPQDGSLTVLIVDLQTLAHEPADR